MTRLLLAFETATRFPGVAVLRDGELLAEVSLPPTRPVSEGLLGGVDDVLRAAGVALGAIEAFAVSIGPGSFTGLRVGLATVKGLAFGSAVPVAPVPTLAALAWGATGASGPVAAVLDARRGEVYGAAFARAEEGPRELVPEGLYGVAELAARLPRPCTLVGEGAALHAAVWREALGPDVEIVSEEAQPPRARDVGRLGGRILARGGAVLAAALVPRYLRRAEAEVRRTGERVEPAPPL